MSRKDTKIVVRGCHNLAGYRELVKARTPGLAADLGVLPCSGKTEPQLALKFFEQGYDGALILACPRGACRFVEGNLRAAKRMAYAGKWLDELGLEPERLRFVMLEPSQVSRIPEMIKEFAQAVAKLGPTGVTGGRGQ